MWIRSTSSPRQCVARQAFVAARTLSSRQTSTNPSVIVDCIAGGAGEARALADKPMWRITELFFLSASTCNVLAKGQLSWLPRGWGESLGRLFIPAYLSGVTASTICAFPSIGALEVFLALLIVLMRFAVSERIIAV
ncbi:hypothetical protein NA56DRAFT_704808 [Hyaloscypha hepaticicola]|uniref:Uncharacterized protein n=1 Tax=Hyaloscypha hepaticicola TaxID=2082293 RepID=A0A2J6Q2G5_9HELO|nr:hypothetical protein NA56DRAFT_704808 [Hyaloscypha hepaticicola]